MSKYKDGGAAVTLAQPRLRKPVVNTQRVPDQEDAFQMPQLRNKRKAPESPTQMTDKAVKVVKRSALGNVTNAAPTTTTNATGALAKKTVLQQIDNLKIDNKLPKVSKGKAIKVTVLEIKGCHVLRFRFKMEAQCTAL